MVDLKSYKIEDHYKGSLSLVLLKDREAGVEQFFYVEEGEGWRSEGFLERHKLFCGAPIGRYDHINHEAHRKILEAIEMHNSGEEVDFENLLAHHLN